MKVRYTKRDGLPILPTGYRWLVMREVKRKTDLRDYCGKWTPTFLAGTPVGCPRFYIRKKA